MSAKVKVGVRAIDGSVNIEPAEIEHWASLLGLQQLVPERFSSVLVMDLLNLSQQGVHERAVLDEIRALEAGAATSTKEATQFTKNPVLAKANLWHKHFFAPTMNMLATNLLIELKGEAGIGRTVTANLGTLTRPPTEQDFSRLSHALFAEPFFSRFNRGAMTGEWLIYIPTPTGNIYLGACPHSTGDDGLIRRLAIWAVEFPGLFPGGSGTFLE